MSKDDEDRAERMKALAARTDEPDTSDIREASAEEWAHAQTGRFYRPKKEAITIRVDADVLDWFRRSSPGGSGYQTAINAALRKHISSAN